MSDRPSETDRNDQLVWVWRILPRWSLNSDLANGVKESEDAAKLAVETAMQETDGYAAIICKLGLDSGEWIPFTKPAIGVRTINDAVKWFDPDS